MQRIGRRDYREYVTFYVFMLPALVFIALFILYPMIQSLVLPFFRWKGYGELTFIGLRNYENMFTRDEFFWTALKNSLLFALFGTVGTVCIGFILAVLIDFKIRFWATYRLLFFVTVSISVVVTGLLWVKILDPFGLLNALLGAVGLEHLQRVWLGDVGTAMPAIIITAVWQYSGFTMIFFLAGMQAIDGELYESALIDGASRIRTVFSITIPLLRHVFAVVVMLQLIFSFKVFDQVWVMTQGGPAGATEVLGTHLYKDAFRLIRFGYASVIASIMFVIALLLSLIYIKVSGYTGTLFRARAGR
jgi:ABC-type sugar transport system permease subunit